MRPATRQGAWREAHLLFSRHRRPLLAALLLVATNRLAGLALPMASRYVVDEVIARRRTELLESIALFACAAIAIETVAGFGAVQLAGVASQRAVARLRQDLQRRVVGFPLRLIEEGSTGSLAARVIQDSEQACYLVGNGVVQLMASILTATLASALLFRLDAVLTLAVLAILAVYGAGVRGAFRRLTPAFEGVSRRQAELSGWLCRLLGGLRVVKAYAAERREAHSFAQESHRLVRESLAALRVVSLLDASGSLVTGAVGVVVLVAGSRAVLAGSMSLGSLVMFISLTGLLLAPVLHMAAGAGELGRAVAALRRIAQLRGRATEEEDDRSRRRIRRVVGTVDFEDMSYGYVPERLAVRGVNLHAPAGSTTALVGPSGSGKSTLCRLLLGFDRPTSGRILVDGRDLATVQRRQYRVNLGAVLQEDVLFDGTIADNIRYGRPRADWAEVLAAARSAHCDEFAEALPDGYGAVVGERGIRLSGGQRQRVAIARAMLADPRILILDEATSQLDSENELFIQAALGRLRRGRTTFVIAHRLSTVRSADQIVVLDGGAMVARGTHDELVACDGRYRQLHQLQCGRRSSLLTDEVPTIRAACAACASLQRPHHAS
ncbi:MAG: ABC transporter ATP-binding protein [Gemmatimonadales bacterium]